MLGDALQEVDEISVDVDSVQPPSYDQRLDDAKVLRGRLRPAVVRVLAPHWHDSQCPLEVVCVEGHVGVPLCHRSCRLDTSVILGALRNNSGSIQQRIQRTGRGSTVTA